MKAAEIAKLPERRVIAVPYQKPGYTLSGYLTRIMTQTTVRTLDVPIHETPEAAIAHGEKL